MAAIPDWRKKNLPVERNPAPHNAVAIAALPPRANVPEIIVKPTLQEYV